MSKCNRGLVKLPEPASLFASLKQVVAQVAFVGVPCIHPLNTAADTATVTAIALSVVPSADSDLESHTLIAVAAAPE